MATARVCRVVSAPSESVYRALVDWGNWGAWMPMMKGAELESGGPGVVPSVRVMGGAIRERLTACDERRLTLSYVIEGTPPFPARTYGSTVQVIPLTDGTGCVVDWTATFDADAATEGEVRTALEGYFNGFVDNLSANVV